MGFFKKKKDKVEKEELYKYVTVTYDDDFSEREYSYKTDIEDIEVGDEVLVDRNGNEAYGTVTSINLYAEKDVPYPLDKTKDIIEILNRDDEEDEDLQDYHDYQLILNNDYHKILLNCMYGYISIKKLMSLIIATFGRDKYTLYYYPKFNLFFYKYQEDLYDTADYRSKPIDTEMFRIIERESIIVPQVNYKEITGNEAYVKAVKFCQENGLRFVDDTDVSEYTEEKQEVYKEKRKNTEIKKAKEFESIEELKEYLKENNKVERKVQNPSYRIENDQIVHYLGYLSYDSRVFLITKYLKENNYIFDEYYNNDKYMYLYDKPLTEDIIKELNVEEVSYIILRSFNIERICEGTIKHLLESGFLLKLVEKAEELRGK